MNAMTDWQRKYEEASAAAAIMGMILYTLGVVVVTVGLTMAMTKSQSEGQVCISWALAERVHAALVAHESDADEWAGMVGDSRGSGPADYCIEVGKLVDEFAKAMDKESKDKAE